MITLFVRWPAVSTRIDTKVDGESKRDAARVHVWLQTECAFAFQCWASRSVPPRFDRVSIIYLINWMYHDIMAIVNTFWWLCFDWMRSPTLANFNSLRHVLYFCYNLMTSAISTVVKVIVKIWLYTYNQFIMSSDMCYLVQYKQLYTYYESKNKAVVAKVPKQIWIFIAYLKCHYSNTRG